MNFAFEIPRNNKELLAEDGNCSNYFVKQIYDAPQIPTQIRGKFRVAIELYYID